jgi:hypothetical protein
MHKNDAAQQHWFIALLAVLRIRFRTYLVGSGRLGPDPDPALINDSLSTFLVSVKARNT